jgi:CxxC motif-containing protein (DUF1111 family)
VALTLVAAAAPAAARAGGQDPQPASLGGAATVADSGINAFGYPAAVLTREQRRAFAVGNAFFKDNWVAAPASAAGRDGLGPLFNARSCSSCHLRDGRGRPPLQGDRESHGLLLRLGVGTDGPDAPHPVYGGQLQDAALADLRPEGRIALHTEPRPGRLPDGTAYELLLPRYEIAEPGYGPLGDDLRVGPRIAPALIGLGLLEAIPDADLLFRADPDDRDGDGISGRAHWVTDARTGARALGRFGWKATQPTVEQQAAAAFAGDLGITSTLFPDAGASAGQREARAKPSGGEPELDDHKLERIAFYCRVLAVPARRGADRAIVQRGERLFGAIGCAACHVPVHRTGDAAVVEAYRRQTIRPYTDLLLHDLGADLADGKRDGDAQTSEWRTPPLWGIGLVEVVNGHTRFLHDGRARDLHEAILWHGGEASRSADRYRALEAREREALLEFLRSL